MKEIFQNLNISDNSIQIYLNSVGRVFLTKSEISFQNPEISEKEIGKSINELIDNDLFLNLQDKLSNIIPHYMVLPPFSSIKSYLDQIYEKDSTILQENTHFLQRLENLRNILINQIKELNESIITTMNHDLKDSGQYLQEFKGNLKKLIKVELENLSEYFKSLKIEHPMQEVSDLNISNFVSEKVDESYDILEKMFNQFDEIITQMVISNFTSIFESNSNYYKSLEDSFSNELNNFLGEIKSNKSKIDTTLTNFLEDLIQLYSIRSNVKIGDFWKIENIPKIKEEIEFFTQNCEDTLIMILPNLTNYFKSENGELVELKGIHVKLVSSLKHNEDFIQQLKQKNSNIEYKYLKDLGNLMIITDSNKLIFGIDKKGKNFDSIIGYGTNNTELINIMNPLIQSKWESARYTKEEEITNGFNDIIRNINVYTGIRIGEKMRDILDIAFEKDGISLKLLELKILLSNLGKTYTPLKNEMKEDVIESIKKLNEDFSSFPLESAPEYTEPSFMEGSESKIPKDFDISFETLDSQKINYLFELFLEKAENLKGAEISEQIDKLINLVLELQGFSKIAHWSSQLSDKDEELEESSIQEIKADFIKWKNYLLAKTASKLDMKRISSQDSSSTIIDGDYKSPGAQQTQFTNISPEQSFSSENSRDQEKDMKKISEKFQNLLNEISDLKGSELSNLLQDIADIILLNHGAMAAKDLRNWISKLRSIREPLEEEIKDELKNHILNWQERFSVD